MSLKCATVLPQSKRAIRDGPVLVLRRSELSFVLMGYTKDWENPRLTFERTFAGKKYLGLPTSPTISTGGDSVHLHQ